MLGLAAWWPKPVNSRVTSPVTSVSGELFAPGAPGVELCYQTFGDPDGDPLLLVMGLGGPMTWWDPELCTALAERGFYVIRYDNRDTGRSTKVGGRVTRSMLVGAFAVAGSARRTASPTWPPMPSPCSTTSASSRPTSPASRWAA